MPWTNYLPCSDTEAVKRAELVLYVYFIGYSISVLALLLSLCIFVIFRQLKCTRVTIHKHLFLSYAITAVMWIIYYASSSFQPLVLVQNPVWCKVLHVLAQYVTLCNYAWMMCEGFYLHTILVWTFTNEKNILYLCYLIGWGLPIIPTAVYAGLRAKDYLTDTNCWHEDTYYKWILIGPVIFSLFINLFFLINVLRILCSKARSPNSKESSPFKQTVRATLILIPLFGIQCFLVPIRPADTAEDQQFIYDIISATLSSFQGFMVAILFCFLNGEVLLLMKNQFYLVKRRMSRTETGRSYIYSAVNSADSNSARKRSIHLLNQKILGNNEMAFIVPETTPDNNHELTIVNTAEF